MTRNYTVLAQHDAQFRADAYCRPRWRVGTFAESRVEPYAVSTLAADLVASGWRELSGPDRPERDRFGQPVDRAFIWADGPSHYGTIALLVRRRNDWTRF